MTACTLRPPLPAPLTHDGIRFVLDRVSAQGTLSPQTLVAIAASLTLLLPDGDFHVDAQGQIQTRTAAGSHGQPVSLWYQAGLLAGIERSSL
jgi:hypothetical protein